VICSTSQPKLDGYKSGMALGIVDIVGCRQLKDGRFGWVLDNPKPYAKPFRVKGQLGMFQVQRGAV
jgi:hypothetical protein